MNFTFVDWAIVATYLAASVGIGLLGKRYVGTVSHYLVAGRELGLYVGIATLAATEIGTITFMYNAELGYKYGFAAFAAAIIVVSGYATILYPISDNFCFARMGFPVVSAIPATT